MHLYPYGPLIYDLKFRVKGLSFGEELKIFKIKKLKLKF